MSLRQLLFSLQGRIRRLHWWVASIAAGAVAGSATAILELAARLSGSVVVDPSAQQFEPTGLYGIAVITLGLANTWINFALGTKRLHDRDRTAWWLAAQILVVALAAILAVVALTMPEEQAAIRYVIAGAAGLAALAISIWLFVEIGFLRGTPGPNRFGPDPLGARQADVNL